MKSLRHAAAIAVLMATAACATVSSGQATSSPPAAPTNASVKAITYKDSVELRDARDVRKLIGAPEDFKQYIAGAADATGAGSDPDDKCAPRIFVDAIDGDYASGGYFDCGGANLIWARADHGIWRQIWGGQISPDCPTMKKYRVPASIAGNSCWDVKAQKDVPYPG